MREVGQSHRGVGPGRLRITLYCTLVFGLSCLMGCPPPIAKTRSHQERSRVSVIRERPGSARIDGLGPIRGFARGRDSTFIHCLELILDVSGRKMGYDELMGVSGLAFRMQFRVDRWDVGNPDPLVGDNCLDELFSAIGWGYELRIVRHEELAERNALRRAIAQSIDRGMPVLASNIMPPEDWGIITGYKADRSWLCRSYNGGAERVDKLAAGWPTAVVILNSRNKRGRNLREAHAASIRRAVAMFEKRAVGSHAMGHKAFDEWRQSLRSVAGRRYVHANFWTYIGLIDARGAAVRYLRSIAGEFGPRAVHITKAANLYDQEVRLLIEGLQHVPGEKLYRGSLPPVEMRNAQINLLRQAQMLETNAIESLRKAI